MILEKEFLIVMSSENKNLIEKLCELYPIGTRIKLVKSLAEGMPPQGSVGTIAEIRSSGAIVVRWDIPHESDIVYDGEFEVIEE